MANGKSNKSVTTAAVAYLRKSTAGQNSDGRERQEKSIDQQRREIIELAKRHGYKIIRWYTDEGVSGWKRNGKRPGFDQMLADAKSKGDFQAVLCDDLDRFSRAEVMEVFSDLSSLASGGVKTIHCVNQGEYSLGDSDIGRIIRMVVDVHGGNEFSRRLARRICLAMRNMASEGKRPGGPPPYGWSHDGNGGLNPNPDQFAIGLEMWERFARGETYRGIARLLNDRGVPTPKGAKAWWPNTVKVILNQPAWAGTFVYGRNPSGQFYRTRSDGEVVEAGAETNGKPAFVRENVHERAVDLKTFKRVQRRIAEFKTGRKPRRDGYALSRVLVCGHCGRAMGGRPRPKGKLIYSCNGEPLCKQRPASQDLILPFLMRLLAEEIESLKNLEVRPSVDVEPSPDNEREIEALRQKIAKSEDRILDIDDRRTRQSLDTKISAMRDALERLEAEAARPNDVAAEIQTWVSQLSEWWEEFEQRVGPRAVHMQVPPEHVDAACADTAAYIAAWGDRDVVLDPRAVNEALHELGAEMRLWWRTEPRGKRHRHVLERGRFRLGERVGSVNYALRR